MLCSVSFLLDQKEYGTKQPFQSLTIFPLELFFLGKGGYLCPKGLCMIADERMIQIPTLENIYNQEIRDQEKLLKIEIA